MFGSDPTIDPFGGVVAAAAAAPSWAPSDIANWTLDINPVVANVTLNGADVSAVADVSGAANHFTQVMAGSQPLYVASDSDFRGNPSIDFDGVDEYIEGTAASNIITVSTGTIALALLVRSIATNAAAFYDNDATIGEQGGFFGSPLRSAPSINIGNFTAGADEPASPTAFTLNAVHTVVLRHGGGTLAISVDGGAEQTVASGNTASLASLMQFARSYAGTYSDMKLARCLAWKTSVTAGERASIHTYLAGLYQ